MGPFYSARGKKRRISVLEKIGLYAPVIAPLIVALSAALGLHDRHGAALIVSIAMIAVGLILAVLGFRRVQREVKESKSSGDA